MFLGIPGRLIESLHINSCDSSIRGCDTVSAPVGGMGVTFTEYYSIRELAD